MRWVQEQEERHLGDTEVGLGKRRPESRGAGGAWSTTPGRQAPRTKGCDQRAAEPAAALKKPFGYGISIKKIREI